MESIIQDVTGKLNALLEANPKHFLVEIRVKPTNNFKVFIDGDEGVTLSELVSYNRKLYRQIEESGAFPDGNYSLEVSSPGLDEPLKMQRQYNKNVGRFVEVTLNDGTKREGKMLEVHPEDILVEWEEGKGKKKEVKQENIRFADIKTTKIQIRF